jgi:hypothetical protein
MIMSSFLAVIYCRFDGMPRVHVHKVDADLPLGFLNTEAYNLIGLSRNDEILYFKVIQTSVASLPC